MQNDQGPETKKNRFDLHDERLATTDEFGNRIYLYPEDVKGKWRTRRTYFYWFLIALYLVLPWIYIDGHQAILLDVMKREFSFFGFTFYGVEPKIIFTFFTIFIFLIGFITSIWGRLWCGWGCPQTVFIDSIYRKIETFIEGRARQRRELDNSPMSLTKFFKKTIKWILFLIVSLHIVHSGLGYFVGTHELLNISMHSPSEHMALFITMCIMTGIILFDFGWFREQFCIIACPYGRIQSVMMDMNSAIVAYLPNRGEPRRGTVAREQEGDCINCYHCVKVCPTGIDIRRGTQLECIACTNCIDACDSIMEKVGRPQGLIKYTTENELRNIPHSHFNLRSAVYLTILFILIGIQIYVITTSQNLNFVFLRSKIPFIQQSQSTILNNFQMKIEHQGEKKYSLFFEVDKNFSQDKIQVIVPQHPYPLNQAVIKTPIFFKFDRSVLKQGTYKIKLNVYDGKERAQAQFVTSTEVTLVGPVN